ncbi:cytochrome c oxidase subunit 5B, mitochondrial-like [Saccoglossus kowalevskii]|uniref:Cytochrome c oxidase subunit 5B, mitochondrial-like n=1 Tax=Saccoglossus kowalevskii TaxID=10224 RepID=A0ABM0GTT6_SACKO|nr:PREDICTED: cytochrome c oxidase subunit 5B, mitochondrial-like [Saccoglossus kowalevskii]
MASLLCRARVLAVAGRSLMVSSVRTMSKPGGIPLNVDHATGMEKLEMDMKEAGLEDPFDLKVKNVVPGTRESPTLVPSIFEKRMVGCVCEEEATVVNWMWLEKGGVQRCECGHFFQLTEAAPLQPVQRV